MTKPIAPSSESAQRQMTDRANRGCGITVIALRRRPSRLLAGNGIAGVELQLPEGWKTYWRTPGDAGGVPPTFDWSKSDNLASVKVLYPAPKRFSDRAGDTVGYKGTVVFPVEVIPKDAS